MKLGLALAGGGIRGIAHAGVLKALEENNIKYLFLFPEDFLNNDYKTKFINFVNFKRGNVA